MSLFGSFYQFDRQMLLQMFIIRNLRTKGQQALYTFIESLPERTNTTIVRAY